MSKSQEMVAKFYWGLKTAKGVSQKNRTRRSSPEEGPDAKKDILNSQEEAY